MPRESFIDFLHRKYTYRRECLERIVEHLGKIKETCRSIDPDCRVLLFGSYARGTLRPDSDVDVLLISRLADDPWRRAKLYVKIFESIGFENIFELHIVTPGEYEGWYKRFIDVHLEV